MKTKYLEVAKIIRSSLSQTKDEKLKEYLGRTAISRAYEAVFLELFFYFTEDLNIPYTQMKKLAKEHFAKQKLKIPINKHTVVGAYLEINYGKLYGRLFEELRQARNDVDYNLNLQTFLFGIGMQEVSDYIKRAEIILKGVLKWAY